MSHTFSLNRQCTRCPREERTEVTAEEVMKISKSGDNRPPALVVTIDGKNTIELPFMCSVCRAIVGRYLEHVAKKPKKASSLRDRGTIDVEDD